MYHIQNLEASGQDYVSWRGVSGQSYALHSEDRESFILEGHSIYVLAENDSACWVGTADDVIADIGSRESFRSALRRCSEVLCLEASPEDETERMKAAYDLRLGHSENASLRTAAIA